MRVSNTQVMRVSGSCFARDARIHRTIREDT